MFHYSEPAARQGTDAIVPALLAIGAHLKVLHVELHIRHEYFVGVQHIYSSLVEDVCQCTGHHADVVRLHGGDCVRPAETQSWNVNQVNACYCRCMRTFTEASTAHIGVACMGELVA